ncbi:hypothetical protein IGI04_025419 [Brassica rapa subsp. trilocularis]|uniref:DDE-1 domain-containing protein n=1 Tax=Brassica rapa subsp. trilocularis TaxID=1813537 RepID=A0ABQ7KUE4_BRACM|nr:hypothetical protein IGI04_025419 [Brassica rapa subsp. trilocularis]
MSHVQCLDIDGWYLCTLIDINLHLSRHLLVLIDNTDAHRSIVLPLVDLYMVSSGEMSFKLQNTPNECFTLGVSIIGNKDFRQVSGAAGSVTKIGQASMNQNLMVVATKLCSLLFNLYPRVLCESKP